MVVGAVAAVALDPPGARMAIGVAVFFALTLLAELKPVPLDEDEARLVSLAFVFIVSAQILFGWQYGVLISAVALVVAQVGRAHERAANGVQRGRLLGRGLRRRRCSSFVTTHDAAAPHFGRLTALSFAEGALFVALNVRARLHRGRPARGHRGARRRHRPPAPLRAGLRDHGLHRGARGRALVRLAAAARAARRPRVRARALPALRAPQPRRAARRVHRQPHAPAEPPRVRGRPGRDARGRRRPRRWRCACSTSTTSSG